MPDKVTLSRFTVFGLFAYRAARKLDYPEAAVVPVGGSDRGVVADADAVLRRATT